MEIDFTRIQDREVGYNIRANMMEGPRWLETLKFGDFIPPYSHEATTPQQVYGNLEQALDIAKKQQDSVTDKKRSVMLDVLATATLQRETMMNSMQLIKEYYL
jgi:hypothetical protein